MKRKLPTNKSLPVPVKLNRKELPFRIAIETKLENGFEFKDMNPENIKALQDFLDSTVYKQLTISEVDKLYLRKRGMSDAPSIFYGEEPLLHYGKDRTPFRLFGYYNSESYFVICRIDGGHKTHKG